MSLLFGRRGALTSRAALDPRARLLGPPACAGLHHAKSRPVLISEQTKRLQRRKSYYWVLPAMKYSLGGLQSSRGGATPLRTPEGPAVSPQHMGWLRSVVSAVAVLFLLVAVIAPAVTAAMANPSAISKLFSAEVGVVCTILSVLITVFLYFLASVNSIKERIATDRDEMKDLISNGITEMIKQRATDREEMKDLISNGIAEMIKQRATDREEMKDLISNSIAEMIKQRATDREEMINQRAADRDEMKDLISNGIYRLENQIVQLKEEMILQRPSAT